MKPDKGDSYAIENQQSFFDTLSSSDDAVGLWAKCYRSRREQCGLTVGGDLAGNSDAPQLPDGQPLGTAAIRFDTDVRAGWNAGRRYHQSVIRRRAAQPRTGRMGDDVA